MNKEIRLQNIKKELISKGLRELAATISDLDGSDSSGAIPTEVIVTKKQAERLFDDLNLQYSVIGGLGMGHLGHPRYTEDVDVVMDKAAVDKLLENRDTIEKYHFKIIRSSGSIVVIQDKKHHIPVEILITGSKLSPNQEAVPSPSFIGSPEASEFGMLWLKLNAFREDDIHDLVKLVRKYGDKYYSQFSGKLKERFDKIKKMMEMTKED